MIHNICDYSWPLNDHVHQDWATTFATVTMPAENDNSNVLSTIGDRPHTADNSVSLPLKYLYHVIKCVTEFATSSLSICRLVDKVLSGRRPIRFLLVRYRHLALVGNTVCHLALEKTFLKTAYYARFQGKGAFCAILFCVVAFVGVVLFFLLLLSFSPLTTRIQAQRLFVGSMFPGGFHAWNLLWRWIRCLTVKYAPSSLSFMPVKLKNVLTGNESNKERGAVHVDC